MARLICIILSLFLAACGGGGSAPLALHFYQGGADRLMVSDVPDRYYSHTNLEFDFQSNGYLSESSAHFGIVLRGDTAVWTQYVRGEGLTIGCVGNAIGAVGTCPTTQAETWFNGLAPGGNALLAGMSIPPVLIDGAKYRFRIETDADAHTIRYTIAQNGASLYDSGLMKDQNIWFDPSKNGIYIGHVFDNPGNWSATFDNFVIERY